MRSHILLRKLAVTSPYHVFIALQEWTPKTGSINYTDMMQTGLTEWHSFFLFHSKLFEEERRGRCLCPYEENGLESSISASANRPLSCVECILISLIY
ncbi:MAG: hypothetical protein ACTSRL_14345 [Candidatus Helarchaeota archaeon]